MSAEIISIIQFLLDSPLVKWLLIFGIASLAIPVILMVMFFVIYAIQFVAIIREERRWKR